MAAVRWNTQTRALSITGPERELTLRLLSPGFAKALAVLFIGGLLTHGRTIGYGFLFGTDDNSNFISNTHLNPPSLATLGAIWSDLHYKLYIPVTETSWWLLKRLTTALEAPDAFAGAVHGMEILVHILNAALVYLLATWLTRTRTPARDLDLAALFGALLFLVHPVQSQSVSHATCTKEVFATAPALLGALLALVHFESGDWLTLLLSTLCQTLAILCLPVTLVLPVLLMIAAPRDRRARACCAWLPLTAVLAWIGMTGLDNNVLPVDITQPVTVFSDETLHLVPLIPLWLKPVAALEHLAFYAGKTLVPYPLLFDYESFFMATLADPPMWLRAALAACALAALGWWAWRRRARREDADDQSLAFGAAWALAFLAPVLGFLPIIQQGLSDVADRYLYLPLAGVGLVVAWGARHWRLEASARRSAPAALLLVACAGATIAHQTIWSSPEALYSDQITRLPNGWRGPLLLGKTLHSIDHQYEAAARELHDSFESYKSFHQNRGVYPTVPVSEVFEPYKRVITELGRVEELITLFRDTVALDTSHRALAQFGLGNLLVLKGETSAGLAELAAASRLDPSVRERPFMAAEELLRRYPERFSARALSAVALLNPEYLSLRRMAELAAHR